MLGFKFLHGTLYNMEVYTSFGSMKVRVFPSACLWNYPSLQRLLLLASLSNTLLECRSNQRIRPKTDSHVPQVWSSLTPSNRVRR